MVRSIVDVDFPMQVYFLVAFEGTEVAHPLLNHTFRTLPSLNLPLQKVGIKETETMSRSKKAELGRKEE